MNPLKGTEEASINIVAGRLLLARHRPYIGAALWALQPVVSHTVPTIAVAKDGTLYVNVDYVSKKPVAVIAVIIYHEVLHLVLRHADRGVGKNHKLWNIACDIVINSRILREKSEVLKLPPTAITPDTFNFPWGLSEEEYYELLIKRFPEEAEHSMSGTKGQNPEEVGSPEACTGDCGSGADGHKRPWETGSERSIDWDILRRKVAQEARQSGRGTTPAWAQVWADNELKPPRLPWPTLLRAAVRGSITAYRTGRSDYTRRLSRKTLATHGRIITPAMIEPVPTVAIVIDTSGSMGSADINRAVAEAQGVLQAVQASIVVIDCDTTAKQARRISNIGQIHSLKGGGGTDMRRGIEAAAQAKAQIIVVVTDGQTPWPENKPAGVASVVVVLTRPDERKACPPWAKVVEVA